METTEKKTFMEGAKKLQNVLDRFIRAHEEHATCERCSFDSCVCGTPEFESFVSEELNRAEETEGR